MPPELIIVADENIPEVEHYFGDLGAIRRVHGRQIRPEQVAEADILLVRSVTRVDRQLLASGRVSFVGTCTIGIDHLDTVYLDQQGIAYSNAPGCNANSVVDYVFAALSALAVPWWERTVGIVGGGNVGQALIRRLQAMGLACRCYDPFLNAAQNPFQATLEEVLAADIVSLHAPLTTTGLYPSWHLLGAAQLSSLKPGAVLISAGRGAVVDNRALLALLQQRDDLKVVMDVWESEPELSIPLLERVDLGTPHIAGYSYDGKVTGTAMIRQALDAFLASSAGTNRAETELPLAGQLRSDVAVADTTAQVFEQVLAAYDIRGDDRRLRDCVASGEPLATGFDRLRKEYPERREFSRWQLVGADQGNPHLRQLLAGLGFQLM